MLYGWQHLTREEKDRIETGIVENRVLGGPWHLNLYTTNICNVDCFFCISQKRKPGISLDWGLLESTLRENARRDQGAATPEARPRPEPERARHDGNALDEREARAVVVGVPVGYGAQVPPVAERPEVAVGIFPVHG